METLANEVLLRIFSYFTLTSLIAARGVCKLWRSLIPHTQIPPERLAMLELYDTLIQSPLFYVTRPWVAANAKPFDREGYIATLTKQYYFIPEQFKLWILEWPRLASFGCLWPGLPRKKYDTEHADNINILRGTNWLGYPQIVAVVHKDYAHRRVEHVPALLVRSATLLIFDDREELQGKVITSPLMILGSPEGIKNAWDKLDADWIAYQNRIWREIEEEAERREDAGETIWSALDAIPTDNTIVHSAELHEREGIPWLRRNDPEHQRWLEHILAHNF